MGSVNLRLRLDLQGKFQSPVKAGKSFIELVLLCEDTFPRSISVVISAGQFLTLRRI